MADRIIGILGGMGPDATVDFYKEILRLTPAKKDQDHIRVLIYSNPKIPDRTAAILEGGDDPLPHLTRSAKVLEDAGVGILTIPCNAAHYFIRPLRARMRVPILSMIEESLRDLKSNIPEVPTVGLLAATGTVRSGVYHSLFQDAGINVITPSDADQKVVDRGIDQVKGAAHTKKTQECFEAIGARLVSKGAQAMILGCTEIPLAFDTNRTVYPCLNPTRALAKAAIDWALKG